MPDITIIKLKIRRGTNNQRKTVVLEQGELGYTIDETRRVYVGDGSTPGGVAIGSVSHLPIISDGARTTLYAERGDIVYDTSMLYQLTGTDPAQTIQWKAIGTVFDNSTLEYNAQNIALIKDNGITGTKFAPSAAYSQGGLIATAQNGISANVDNDYLTIQSNKLTIAKADENKIVSSSFTQGIIGGSGSKIRLSVDSNLFGFSTNVLTLTALPNSIVNVSSLSSASIGAGLIIDNNQLKAEIQTVDTTSLAVVNNQLQLVSITSPGTSVFSNIQYNQYGQVINTDPILIDTLSGNDTTLPYFNGDVDQTVLTNQTLYNTISTGENTTETKQLTSAGFIIVDIGFDNPVAIPIFNVYNTLPTP
jgi:hypothetical protein